MQGGKTELLLMKQWCKRRGSEDEMFGPCFLDGFMYFMYFNLAQLVVLVMFLTV